MNVIASIIFNHSINLNLHIIERRGDADGPHSLTAAQPISEGRGVDVAPGSPIGNGVVGPVLCASHVSGYRGNRRALEVPMARMWPPWPYAPF